MGTLSLVSGRDDASTADGRLRSYLGLLLIDPAILAGWAAPDPTAPKQREDRPDWRDSRIRGVSQEGPPCYETSATPTSLATENASRRWHSTYPAAVGDPPHLRFRLTD